MSSVFVARDDELAVVRAALDRAARGEPAVVFVGGEAGVGKSRLVAEAVRPGGGPAARVLVGACVELGEEGLPFAPLTDALRELVRTCSPEELAAVLGPARAELAQLLPQLDEQGATTDPRDRARARLFEQILGLVERLAVAQPLILVVEDLHWADRSTLDLVAFLTRAIGPGVGMVITYRTDELHRRHPLRPVMAELERLHHVRVVELGRLDVQGVTAQLAGILGSAPEPALAREVFERSGGNPFFTEEALQLVRSGRRLSSSLRDLLFERVEQLGEPTQRLLRVVAVGGQRVEHGLLDAVSMMAPTELHAALREAIDAHVLTVDDAARGYAFRHALVRDAVADDTLPGELVALHRAYAEALERDPQLAGEAPAAVASEIAHHWYAAHDLPRALTAAVDAAGRLTQASAYSEASLVLTRCLEIWPAVPDAAERTGFDHVGLLERAVDAARAGGEQDRAIALVDVALNEIDRDAEPMRAAMLFHRRGLTHAMQDADRALVDLQEAAALVPPAPPSPELATVLADLARGHLWGGHFRVATEVSARALDAARASGDLRSEASALAVLGSAQVYLGEVEAGTGLLRQALTTALEVGDDEVAMRAYINLSDVLEARGSHGESAEAAAAGAAFAAEAGLARSYGSFALGNLAEALLRLGRLGEATHYAEEALLHDPPGLFAAGIHLILAEVELQRGAWAAVETELELTREGFGKADPSWQYELPMVQLRIEALSAAGRYADARQIADPLLADQPIMENSRYLWPLLAAVAGLEAGVAGERIAATADAVLGGAHAAGRGAGRRAGGHDPRLGGVCGDGDGRAGAVPRPAGRRRGLGGGGRRLARRGRALPTHLQPRPSRRVPGGRR